MPEAKQEIDIGRPRADAVQRRQRMVGRVGILFREHIEVHALVGDLAREIFQRLDLGRRQAEPAEPIGAGMAAGVVIERVECANQARPDC